QPFLRRSGAFFRSSGARARSVSRRGGVLVSSAVEGDDEGQDWRCRNARDGFGGFEGDTIDRNSSRRCLSSPVRWRSSALMSSSFFQSDMWLERLIGSTINAVVNSTNRP